MARSVQPGAFLSAAQLREPAHRGVRFVARARLQTMLEQAARLEVQGGLERPPHILEANPDSADPEAVHDFRVALRRLRSWLRAFAGSLDGTVPRDPQRGLRDISRLAGRVRDLEVQRLWLDHCPAGPSSGTAAWIAGQVTRELAQARKRLGRSLPGQLSGASGQLAADLQDSPRVTASPGGPMAAALADAIRREREAVVSSLGKVARPSQVDDAHAARIAVKRLRYLLESLQRASRLAHGILPDLARLQHCFGELHDAQVLQQRIRMLRGERARGRAARPGTTLPTGRGLQALSALSARRTLATFRQAQRTGRSRATRVMFTRLATLIRRLDHIARREVLRA